jgi:hypothetical protein
MNNTKRTSPKTSRNYLPPKTTWILRTRANLSLQRSRFLTPRKMATAPIIPFPSPTMKTLNSKPTTDFRQRLPFCHPNFCA